MPDIIVIEAHDQTTVRVHTGDTLVLQLPETPATGYRWVPLQGTPESDEFASGAGVGGGGVRTFRFPMKTPGNTTLELGLARAWEKQAPAKRFTVNVRVLQ